MNRIKPYGLGLLNGILISALVIFILQTRSDPATATHPIQEALKAQHRADSAQALLTQWRQQRQIDSLTHLLRKRDELDSMRANAGLSILDAMRQINGAIPKR